MNNLSLSLDSILLNTTHQSQIVSICGRHSSETLKIVALIFVKVSMRIFDEIALHKILRFDLALIFW